MSDSSIENIITNSGNEFHLEVVQFFRERGWAALVSPYYTDNLTNKPREIDIICEKSFPIERYGIIRDSVTVRLFIECKYIRNKTVFWFDNADTAKLGKKLANEFDVKSSPLLDDFATVKLLIPGHHYFISEKVAKLFSSENNRGIDQEIIYKALNQCLNSLIYYRQNGSAIVSSDSGGSYLLTYPVIICNNLNNFYEAKERQRIERDVLIEINYAYVDLRQVNKNEYFVVDLVNFQSLGIFLDQIEAEVRMRSELVPIKDRTMREVIELDPYA